MREKGHKMYLSLPIKKFPRLTRTLIKPRDYELRNLVVNAHKKSNSMAN